jgi:hypothetical protein
VERYAPGLYRVTVATDRGLFTAALVVQ